MSEPALTPAIQLKFCMHLGHELLLQEERLDENGNKEFHYLVKKG